jgi:ornithine--oxo-acid transaminase
MTTGLDLNQTPQATVSSSDIVALFSEREPERYALHTRHMNEMMVRVLQTIGFDVGFRGGTGQYLFDSAGQLYSDLLLSGWGVFGISRNHPRLREALTAVLAADLPNLVQMDVPPLAVILAERLLRYTPFLEKVFFTNSGAEAVESSIKFARRATGRSGLVYCTNAFPGLSYGALSLNGDHNFCDGFGPLLPHCSEFPSTTSKRSRRHLQPVRWPHLLLKPFRARV